MPVNPTYFVKQLEAKYAEHADPEKAAQMKRYLKDQFDFLGLQRPLRYEISKAHIHDSGLGLQDDLKSICRLCFESPYRELQYFVGDLMRPLIKNLDVSYLELFHELIPVKAWWDSVDFIAPKLAGGLLLQFPDQIPHYSTSWIQSDNIWYQRSAILFQLHYKDKTNTEILFYNILAHAHSKEFFVQKAAGWALREYSKRDASAVQNFIAQHELPKLTVREGLKWLRSRS